MILLSAKTRTILGGWSCSLKGKLSYFKIFQVHWNREIENKNRLKPPKSSKQTPNNTNF